MNRRAIFLFVLLIACVTHLTEAQNKPQTPSADQLNYDEPYNLIELLRLPAKTIITWNPGALRSQPTYKLFLGSRMDFTFEKEVKTWAQKWNDKHGRKYGEVSIVADIAQADIILARYQNLRELVEETVVTEPTKSRSGTPNMIVDTMKTTLMARPQYSYLLLPKAEGLEIIWRKRNLIRQGEKPSQNAASDLLAALTKRLKTK